MEIITLEILETEMIQATPGIMTIIMEIIPVAIPIMAVETTITTMVVGIITETPEIMAIQHQ